MASTLKPASKQQLHAIGAICSRLKITSEEKADMVAGFSNGRTTTSKELYSSEALAMIKHLKETAFDSHHNQAITRMMGKIYSYAHDLGWVKLNASGKVVADGKRVDEWMLHYSYLKKKLQAYTLKELPKLVSQFEQVVKHHLKTI